MRRCTYAFSSKYAREKLAGFRRIWKIRLSECCRRYANSLDVYRRTGRHPEDLCDNRNTVLQTVDCGDVAFLTLSINVYSSQIIFYAFHVQEILKLRKKITTTVQVLTHLKEKLQFVQVHLICIFPVQSSVTDTIPMPIFKQ